MYEELMDYIMAYQDILTMANRVIEIWKKEYLKVSNELEQVKAEREALLKEKAGQEAAQETCTCKNDLKACCTCVSMYCYECINKSEYVMGSFCSCCGRKLK